MSRQSSRRAKIAPAAAAPVPDSAAASRHSHAPAWLTLRGPALTAAIVAAWEARDLKSLCADGDEPAAAWEAV